MAQIILSAQNFDIYDGDGLDPSARTGETNVEMLYKAGAEGVILGHSEVNDIPQIINKKLKTLISKSQEHDSKFLNHSTLLVGETWEEYDGHTINEISYLISQKLTIILKDIPVEFIKNFVIGYEPKWGSRGSGRDDMPPPNPELITECAKIIKENLQKNYGTEISNQIPIIYGGRSNPERTKQILSDENIEGLILGSACNTIPKILEIAKVIDEMRSNKRKILHANFKAYNLTDSYKSYIEALVNLNNEFIIYLSPPYTDIREIKQLILR